MTWTGSGLESGLSVLPSLSSLSPRPALAAMRMISTRAGRPPFTWHRREGGPREGFHLIYLHGEDTRRDRFRGDQ